jgi:hypothetical protein
MKIPVPPDTSGTFEKMENCHKFISNGTVNVVGRMSGDDDMSSMDLWGR